MKSMKLIVLALVAIAGISAQAKDVPKDVQQALISLDKQWGEAGGVPPSWTKLSATTYWLLVPRARRKTKRS